MKRLLLAMLLAVAGISANATVLTFDDIPGQRPKNFGDMPTYKGFSFSSTLDWIDTADSTWPFGAHSGLYTILNNLGGVGVITAADGSDFKFDGLWAETWLNAGSRSGTIEGYNNGVQVWTLTVTLGPNYAQLAGVAGDIDELRLNLGNFFLVDDLALDNAQNVPEPASLALLGLGLAGVAAARRRSKQA